VASPVAGVLPDAAFLQRHGRRVVENQRHFLDLRQPAAQAHLDGVFDRLVRDFGVEFFKLDYNVTPGPGTDLDAFSVGAGLLGHNRAHLDWFERLRGRHPGVVFENCSSGAMRADFAMLERFDFQSTSDQQDFLLYPAIAVGAPVQMLPEQAGNWAYPQPGVTPEEIAFTMVTGMAGRLYLSGFLDGMADDQLGLVSDGVRVWKGLRAAIAERVPRWPSGLPDWSASSLALALAGSDSTLLYVWQRGDDDLRLDCGPGVRADNLVELYPGAWSPRGCGSGRGKPGPGREAPESGRRRVGEHQEREPGLGRRTRREPAHGANSRRNGRFRRLSGLCSWWSRFRVTAFADWQGLDSPTGRRGAGDGGNGTGALRPSGRDQRSKLRGGTPSGCGGRADAGDEGARVPGADGVPHRSGNKPHPRPGTAPNGPYDPSASSATRPMSPLALATSRTLPEVVSPYRREANNTYAPV